jgi:hypothetical protein
MAESELLLQPEILAELKRYRALERRLQVSRQQCQEFNKLAKQIAPGNAPPLLARLSDGSPASELDAALSALRQQIETIYQIEAQLYEQQKALSEPLHSRQSSLPLQEHFSWFGVNVKIALCVVGGIVMFVFILALLHSVIH